MVTQGRFFDSKSGNHVVLNTVYNLKLIFKLKIDPRKVYNKNLKEV